MREISVRRGMICVAILMLAALGAGIVIYGCNSGQQDPVSSSGAASATGAFVGSTPTTGNGAPSGPHYDLNIIGVQKGKTADMTGSNGHVIFVPLWGKVKILLSEGPFQVLDANGTDGSASFQLPNPDSTNSGTTTYSVFARALGKPGGSSVTKLCATDTTTHVVYCSADSMLLVRTKGKNQFTNVTADLLYIYADTSGTGVLVRIPLFDTSLQGYYWDYDNTGLKLAQLRFYQVSTTVP